MTSFSQSLCFGEKTLQELERHQNYEKPVGKRKQTVKTPNRSIANSSDSDVIEESPTNRSTVCWLRDRKNKLNKSRKKIQKTVSCDQSVTSKKRFDASSDGGLTQFFQSDFDFSDAVLQIVPKNVNDSVKVLNNNIIATDIIEETDMFDDESIECNHELPTTAADVINENERNNLWDDSLDLNNFVLNGCDEIKDISNAMELNLKVDDNIALGLDNVTFTQNFLHEASFQNDLNSKNISNATSKFIKEELESCKQSFDKRDESEVFHPVSSQSNKSKCATQAYYPASSQLNTPKRASQVCFPVISQSKRAEHQLSFPATQSNLNSSTASITLNFSDSSEEFEDKFVAAEHIKDEQSKRSNYIGSWGLPELIVQEYKNKGIENMFDWQRECLSNSKILLNNSNLVYCAPTSAGKTLVSEIILIKNVLEKNKKVLIILPFVSVVREKMLYLQDLLTSSGIQVEGYFGGYSARNFDNVHVAVCTIEKANSILNKHLEQNKIDVIGCIVVDEVHLISDPHRGYILELLLTKILYVNRKVDAKIQIVTMSATLPNLDLLTNWLHAEFYRTDFRPVELKEMIKINNQIFDNKMKPLRLICDKEYLQFHKDQDNVGQLCLETILENCSVIVFCPSKDRCETLARHLASFIYNIGKSKTELGEKVRAQINQSLIEETKAQLRNCPTGLDAMLEKYLNYGCAYHHAGLTSDERDIIESAFKLSSVRIIVATSTLSSGVNLPARRVIIRTPMFGGTTMNALTYKQMIGRAGRTGKDTLGESILICEGNTRRSAESLICATLKPLASCLDMDESVHLKRAILEIIASGMASTKSDLEAFCNCTLLSSEKLIEFKYDTVNKEPPSGMNVPLRIEGDAAGLIGSCMQFLLEYEFIRHQVNEDTNETNFIATRLGSACLASSMSPCDGFILYSELQKSRQSFVLETELHAIYLVTPFSVCYQMQDIDWMLFLDMWEKLPAPMRRVGEMVGVTEAFFVKAMRGRKLDYKSLQIHRRFYTALALQELVNEKPVTEVAEKFKCSRGLLQSLQQMASTFAGIVTSFCNALNWTMLATIISQFKERLFFGVHQDLVELMKLPNLNSSRARALFNEGIENLADIANSDVFTIEKILHNSICFDSKKRDGENDWEADQRNNIRFMYVTGKSGLTVREAAKLLIDDARKHLQIEMGVENIVWSRTNEPFTETGIEALRSETKSDDITTILQLQQPATKEPLTVTGIEPLRSEMKHDYITTGPQLPQPINVINKMKRKPIDEILPEYYQETGQHKKLRVMEEISHSSETVNAPSSTIKITSIAQHLNTSIDSTLSPLIDTELREFKDLQIVNVFESLKFFNLFKESVGKSSVIGVSIGVSVIKPNSVIGMNCLENVVDNEMKDDYLCTFDNNKFISGISVSFDNNCDRAVYYLNVQSDEKDDVAITFDVKANFLVNFFRMKHMCFVMIDAKEQCKALLKCFPQLRKCSIKMRDPQIANWLLQPDVAFNLVTMVRQHAPEYNYLMTFSGIGNCNESLGLTCNNMVAPRIRSSLESFVVIKILQSQIERMHKIDSKMVSLFADIEMPIQRILCEMELDGFPVDIQKILDLRTELTDTLTHLEKTIFRMHGKSFNLSSSREVAKVVGINSTNSRISTSKQVLEKLNNKIGNLIMLHRKVETTLTNSIQPLIQQVENNRIYPNSICFTSTGRISIREPNLQSVTKDFAVFVGTDSFPKTISCRQVFHPRRGNQLISADFCQIELRILTHLSGDEYLSEIMKTDFDVFKMIAAKWNNVTELDVTEKQRNDSKQICYGIIYGMGSKSLADSLKCDEVEAKRQQALFHERYPGLRTFTEKVIERARTNGFVETLFGRRRYLEHITSDKPNLRAQAERIAVNTTIQGTAADIAKCAMIEMDKCLGQSNNNLNGANLVLHLHDELIYEAPKVIAKQVAYNLKISMEKCATLNVPLKVRLKIGDSWGAMDVLNF